MPSFLFRSRRGFLSFLWLSIALYVCAQNVDDEGDICSLAPLKELREINQRANILETLGDENEFPSRMRTAFADFSQSFAAAKKSLPTDDHDITERLIYEYLLLVDVLLFKFPPSEYIYVEVGSSPVFLFAFLQFMKREEVTTIDLPISIRKDVQNVELSVPLMHYLSKIFAPTSRDPRALLLIDYAFTGASLARMNQLVKIFLEGQGQPRRVEALALQKKEYLFPLKYSQEHVIVMPHSIACHIHNERCKLYRKYEKRTWSTIQKGLPKEPLRDEYLELIFFLAKMRARL